MTDPKYKVVMTPLAKKQLFDLMINADKDGLKALQGMLDQVKQAAEDGSIDELGNPVDMDRLAIESPELHDDIMRSLEEYEEDEEFDLPN